MGVFHLIFLQTVLLLTYSAKDKNFKRNGKVLPRRRKKSKLEDCTNSCVTQKTLNHGRRCVTKKCREVKLEKVSQWESKSVSAIDHASTCKSSNGCESHTESYFSLNDFFNLKHFRIKPQTFEVYHLTRHEDGDFQPNFFKHEINRLGTFVKYPSSAPKSAVLLAKSGFVYTGGGQNGDDTVTCAFCQGVKKSWSSEDDVEEIHRTVSPSCPLVRGLICGNVPITRNSSTPNFQQLLEELRIQDTRPVDSVRSGINLQSQSERNLSAYSQVSHENEDNEQERSTAQQRELSTPTQVENSSNLPQLGNTNVSTINDELPTNNLPNTSHANFAAVDASTHQSNGTLSNSLPSTLPVNSSTVAANTHLPAEISNSAIQNTSSNANGPTYNELGIVTDRPKRPEYALRSERLKTFTSWPRGHHIQTPELADAGFYYAGYGDCARCFYCGGGLRNWEDDDDVWVEHARWFARCSFIRQRLGQVFVDTVQELNKTLDKIPYSAVMNKMRTFATTYQMDVKDDTLKKDPAVKSVVELGVPQNVVLEMAKIIKAEDSILSSDKLLLRIKEERPELIQIPRHLVQQIESLGSDRDIEHINKLKENNNILRQQTACKICMDKEVEIVFLPCGHLVSCAECASAMKDCPVCRKHVKGTVRAFIS